MPQPNDKPPPRATHKMATVLFADIIGYTAMMENDESEALSKLHFFKKNIEKNAAAHRGEIVQYYGDGCLVVFEKTVDCLRYAMALQTAFQKKTGVPVRVGLHCGEVVVEGGNLYGHPVNLASRIQSMGIAGAVLFSGLVREKITEEQDLQVAALGEFEFKNVKNPTAVFAIANEGFPVPRRTDLQGKFKAPPDEKTGIAILPFLNMSADAENEYFSDGLTEEIINALTQVEGLKVTARTSSFAFKNKNMDVREIGTQLGVATVLEGSVRMAGSKVRITAQLINVADGFHFWSEKFDRSIEDIFAVQDEISLLIAEKLRENTGHFEIKDHLVEAPKIPVETYKLYLKGKYYVRKFNIPDVEKALSIFRKIISMYPDFALAYLGMHYGYTFLAAIGTMSISEAFAKGKSNLDKATELNSNLPECQYHLAANSFWQEWDFEGAYRHLLKALELRPGYADVHQSFAFFLAMEGNFEAAHNHAKTALQLDPFSAMNHYAKSIIFYYQENFGEAIRCSEKSLSFDPDFISSKVVWALSLLAMGRIEEGLAMYQNLPPAGEADLSKLGGSTLAYTMLGDIEKAESGIQQLQAALQTGAMGRALFFLIIIQTEAGNQEAAFSLIEQGIQYKVPFMISLKVDPFLKPLRPLPRFQQLIREIMGEKHARVFSKKKYKKSSLKKENAELYYLRLEKYMREEKPFLNPTLSLRQLAGSIDMHPNLLSQLLNERAGKNFSEYINNYRLETFKTKAEDPANHHLTILAIAYDSGFNSKTVFNTFFKKTMGKTPRAYWKEVVK